MKAYRAVASALLLLVAGAACSRGAVAAKGSSVLDSETIAPQSVDASPVDLVIDPPRVKAGETFKVRTVPRPGTDTAVTATAAHVWLDRLIDNQWQTAWLLDYSGTSVSIESYRAGGYGLDTLGVAPGVLTFKLRPAPPAGAYRLRLAVSSGNSPSENAPRAWATADIQILPPD
jgi:hypothetical protein